MPFVAKMVSVDLSSGEIRRVDLPETITWQFLSGRGINAWLLAQHVGPDPDPFAEESILVFNCGLLTGTAAASSSRLHVNAISPLTGVLGSSNVGGYFGAELRAAGVQSLLIRGRAQSPVTMCIDGEQVELREASHLWGLDTRAATEALRHELGRRPRLMVIGPGGENGVRYACIMTGTRHAAGRTGMGAVMGAKNLKAIAVRGQKQLFEHDEATGALLRDYVDKVRAFPRYETWARFSNTTMVTWADEAGLLATRNYRRVHLEGAEEGESATAWRPRRRRVMQRRTEAPARPSNIGPWPRCDASWEGRTMSTSKCRYLQRRLGEHYQAVPPAPEGLAEDRERMLPGGARLSAETPTCLRLLS